MGPLFVAMPRTKYSGAFSSADDGNAAAPASKLIGCDDEDDEAIARHMSSRLSKRLQMPVYVSCCLSENMPSSDGSGLDFFDDQIGGGGGGAATQRRASALAEKEICRILLLKKI